MKRLRDGLAKLDWRWIGPLAIFALLAPWPMGPEPHALEKLRWLSEGHLRKPLDIFDLFFHTTPMLLLLAKLVVSRSAPAPDAGTSDED